MRKAAAPRTLLTSATTTIVALHLLLTALVPETAAQASPISLPFPMEMIANDGIFGARVEALPERLVALQSSDSVLFTGVPLMNADIEVQRYSWTFAENGLLVMNGVTIAAGDLGAGVDLSIWSGSVVAEPDSEVVLVFSRYGSRGWIRSRQGLLHLIAESGSGNDWSSGLGRMIFDRDLVTLGATPPGPCQSGLLGQPAARPAPRDSGGPPQKATTYPLLECNIAIETDTQFFDLFGDQTAALAYVLSRIGAVSLRYQEQVGVELVVSFVALNVGSDIWTTQDVIGSGQESLDLLLAFRNAWDDDNAPVVADTYHFMSGAELGGGIAYLATLCQPDWSYSVSGNLSGQTPLPIAPGPLNWDYVVTSHELGHTFGAIHTHSYCPPLDECAPSGYYGYCQSTQTCIGNGTIMSYCQLCFGGVSNLTTYFHVASAADMRAFAETSCLQPASTPPGVTELESVTSSGVQGVGASLAARLSGDGRYIAFYSAAKLVPGDTNETSDVFIRDRSTGATLRVSLSSTGTQADNGSYNPWLSGDGRYVVFSSDATNLVSGDSNAAQDVFVRDRATGATSRVSISPSGIQGNASSYASSLSGDGRYVAFESQASNLVAGDTNQQPDVFLHDRFTGATTRVSVDSTGVQGSGWSGEPELSGDGRYVVFSGTAPNLVPGDSNNAQDVFLHDRLSGMTSRVSIDSMGTQATASSGSFSPSVSVDGRYVAFSSYASNLVAGDSNGAPDVFVHDTQTGATTRVSVDSFGNQADNVSWDSSLSGDGRYIAFESVASNLVFGDTAGQWDCFVHDRSSGATTRISVSATGIAGNNGSSAARVSADGRYIGFESQASNLVSNDVNEHWDVLVYDLIGGARVPKNWFKLGVPVGSLGGTEPCLVGEGSLANPSKITYQLTDAAPASGALFLISLDATMVGFKGGSLWPVPWLLAVPVLTSAFGDVTFSSNWPSGIPGGVNLYAQYIISDPTAIPGQGFTMSDCVWLVTP